MWIDGDVEREALSEQTRVSRLYELLEAQIAEARVRLAGVLRSPGDVIAREAEAARLAGLVGRLEDAEQGLVIGRLDGADGRVLYVGRIGLHGENGPDLLDWRAPAAGPFYAATPVDPLGLRRRRHLRCDGRQVLAIADEILDGSATTAEDVVGDGPLTQALQARRTGQMGAAVATLQTEQDAIVRSGHRGVTVVQGGPGTGKSVVALHRAAYLLYAAPRVAELGVLVVGPNGRFLEYISEVLPSLGEHNAVLATCEELAGIPDAAPDSVESARRKGSLAMADELASLVRARQTLDGDFAVRVGQELLRLTQHDIARARDAATTSGLSHNRARSVFKEQLVEAAVTRLQQVLADDLARIDAEAAASTGLDLDQAVDDDLRGLGLDDTFSMHPADELDTDAVRAALLDDAQTESAVQGLWPRLAPEQLVRDLLAHAPGYDWTVADAALLDEAADLLDGPPERIFGHVIIDEAQELGPMQWRMMLRRCPSRSITAVGDFAQAGPAATAANWHHALGPHVGVHFALHTLTVNYRTTAEVLDSTTDLLKRIAPDQTPSTSLRHGDRPRTRTLAARSDLVATLLDELETQTAAYPNDLRAVICPDATLTELTDPRITQSAHLVPASQTRGLEFDSAIVALPHEMTTERDQYVALTRPTHKLCIINLNPAP
ncbi:HelD family protein [Kribbella sp. WER1]